MNECGAFGGMTIDRGKSKLPDNMLHWHFAKHKPHMRYRVPWWEATINDPTNASVILKPYDIFDHKICNR
jgi:hypothetical protein